MKFERGIVRIFELPLRECFRTGFGEIRAKSSVLVSLSTGSGCTGYGEGATLSFPMYSEEYTQEAALTLQSVLLPRVLGREFSNPQEVATALAGVKGHRIAKTAIETAAWDIFAQETGRPLSHILGSLMGDRDLQPQRPRVEVGESIGIPSVSDARIDELIKSVEQCVDAGYKRIKVKITPEWCEAPVAAIRTAFPEIPLMVDGNSSFNLTHIEALRRLDRYNLMMIEQPLGHDDIIDHAKLQQCMQTPVCLDESILSSDDARKALEIGACRIINIKPGRVGGLTECLKIIKECREFRDRTGTTIPLWCGGMLESTIGRFFNLSVAALSDFTLPADMSPSAMYFRTDLGDRPLEVHRGIAVVPNSLGEFGVTEEIIRRHSVDIWEVNGRGVSRVELPRSPDLSRAEFDLRDLPRDSDRGR